MPKNPPSNPASTQDDAPNASEHGRSHATARHPKPLGGDPIATLKPIVSLSSMILNNQDDTIHHLNPKKKPSWLKARLPGGEGFRSTKSTIDAHNLHTVCQEAACPNMGECWAKGVATIMILGDTCTRACGFCNVKTGKPAAVDKDEPRRVAESLRGAGLKHIVITSVDRDDLPDGGAGIWAETIIRTREACPDMSIEVLVGDFKGDQAALQMVIDAKPEIIAHNLETVKRCHPAVRPSAQYERTMELLARVKAQGGIAKTGIMVGIGERKEEIFELFNDLVAMTAHTHNGQDDACDIITIGQYLQPTYNHLPIDRWVHPDEFEEYIQVGEKAGIKLVVSGPLVRSSYLADEQVDRFHAKR